jgi:glycosyltransferase involved in cell wall biosynthesis
VKVAVVGPTYPHRGGIAHYTSLLAFHLNQQCDMRLYGFRQQYPNWLFPGRSQIDPSPKPLVDVEASAWLVPWLPWTWRKVQHDWLHWRPDVVVIQWWVPFMAPMTAWLAGRARKLGSRVVMICHNVLPHERNRFDAVLIRMALSKADQLIVHSAADRAKAISLLPKRRVDVVPHPSYASFQSGSWTRESARSTLDLNGNVLLFFGLVRPYKGLLDLLAAMRLVLSSINATLLVVGEIWGKAEIYRLRVKELGIEQQVQFIDRYVPDSEVPMYFAASDLTVLPYREATGSGVLQLSFGLGVPVVATRTGGMEDSVENGVTGFLVDPGDVSGLSQAILQFFLENKASIFRQNIAQYPPDLGWHKLQQAVIQSSLVNGSKHPDRDSV